MMYPIHHVFGPIVLRSRISCTSMFFPVFVIKSWKMWNQKLFFPFSQRRKFILACLLCYVFQGYMLSNSYPNNNKKKDEIKPVKTLDMNFDKESVFFFRFFFSLWSFKWKWEHNNAAARKRTGTCGMYGGIHVKVHV